MGGYGELKEYDMKKFGKYLTVFVIIITGALSALGAGVVSANAAGADDIPLVYVENPNNVKYFNGVDGVNLRIECSLATEELSYVFETDYKDPYKGTLVLSEDSEKKIKRAMYNIKENGIMQVTAKVKLADGSYEEVQSEEYVIDNVDYMAPQLKQSEESYYYQNNILHYTLFVYDNISAQKMTAASGLGGIMVCFIKPEFDYEIEDINNIVLTEAIEAGHVGIVYEKSYGNTLRVYQYEKFEFKAEEDGLYFVYAFDNIGNATVHFLFPLAINPEFTLDGLNLTSIIETARNQADTGAGKYKQSILDALYDNADALLLAFQKNESDDVKRQALNALRAAQREYNNAEARIAEPVVINGEFLPGTISIRELNAATANLLKGETATPNFIIADYGSNLPANVISAAGLQNANKVIKITYTLKKGESLLTPLRPLVISMTIPTTYKEAVVVSGSDTLGFRVENSEKGGAFLQFESSYSNREFYIVIYDEVNKANLLWLYITLGVIGGLLIIAVILYFAVFRKRLTAKKATQKSNDATCVEEETQDAEDKKGVEDKAADTALSKAEGDVKNINSNEKGKCRSDSANRSKKRK